MSQPKCGASSGKCSDVASARGGEARAARLPFSAVKSENGIGAPPVVIALGLTGRERFPLTASPSDEVDESWHRHIVNTAKHGRDCHAAAGCFWHHDFLSPEDPVDARTLETLRLETWIADETLFAEPYQETVGAALLIRWPANAR